MKKFALLAMVVVFIAGMAWGQSTATQDLLGGTLFDAFNVVETESVEYHLSQGIFSSMVDDYIDVSYYDPGIGTFLFLGGFYDNTFLDGNRISFGYGQTIGAGYLGIYYGGTLVSASGRSTKADMSDNSLDTLETESAAEWDNSLAVLFGTNSIGAFRLDMKFNTESSYNSENLANTSTFNPGILVGLTWGGIDLMGLSPYVTLGVQMPEQTITNAVDLANKDKTYLYTDSTGGFFGVQAGVSHDTGLWGDLSFILNFNDTYVGEVPKAGGGSTKVNIVDGTTNGGFLVGLRGGYANSWEFGKLAIGIGPELNMAFQTKTDFLTDNEDKNNNIEAKDSPVNSAFQLKGLVNAGIKIQAHEKLNLYTGLGLQIFDWRIAGYSYTPKDSKNTFTGDGWTFDGIAWDAPTTVLNFGLTFQPMEGLIIGADVSNFMNNFIRIDPKTMHVITGFASSGANNIGDWATSFIRNVSVNLTVSLQIPAGGFPAAGTSSASSASSASSVD